MAYTYEKSVSALTAERRHQVANVDDWPAWQLVQVIHMSRHSYPPGAQSVLHESCQARKSATIKRLSLSQEDLLKQGKWLSREQQLTLSRGLDKWLTKWKPVGVHPTPGEVFLFQSRVLAYLLSNGSIPVPRTQLLCQLELENTVRLNEDKKCFEFQVLAACCRQLTSSHGLVVRRGERGPAESGYPVLAAPPTV